MKSILRLRKGIGQKLAMQMSGIETFHLSACGINVLPETKNKEAFMKSMITIFSFLLVGSLAQADAGSCIGAVEDAVYQKWASSASGVFGDIQSGATDVIWVRDGVASYQASVVFRKPDSSTLSWANYSVRARLSDCAIVKIRKF